mgnify:CR=1 FL=1
MRSLVSRSISASLRCLVAAALSLPALSACSTTPVVAPTITIPDRQKPALPNLPPFPTPPANLATMNPAEQQQSIGYLWTQAAEAYSALLEINATLYDWITTETCHGK